MPALAAPPAYAQVAARLRDLILTGELPAGERLPNEADLSVRFGVSRSTVREALRVLSSQNLVATSRGVTGGSFVAHPQPETISDSLETAIGLLAGSDAVTVDELLEARELLEVPAARLAATRRTDAHLESLRDTEQRASGAAGVDRFEHDRRFHATILEASGNGLLEIVTRPVFSVLRTRFLREDAPRRFWSQVTADHARVLDAIAAGDAEAAASGMTEHLRHLRRTYERIDRRRGRA